MTIKIYAIAAFIVLAQPAYAGEAVVVSVHASCDKPEDLRVTLKNTYSLPIKFDETLLPWNHSKVLRMEAFQIADSGKTKRLPIIGPVSDYLDEVSIAPQQLLSGKISLNQSFAGFDDANRSGEILIFYRVNDRKLSNIVSFTGDSGVVLIPQKGFFSHRCSAVVRPSQGNSAIGINPARSDRRKKGS